MNPSERLAYQLNAGIELIINDDLISTVLWVDVIIASVLGLLVLWLVTAAEFVTAPIAFCAGIIVSLSTMLLFVAPLEATTAAIFVLFSERPAELWQSHPEEYFALVSSWRARHGEVAIAGVQGTHYTPGS